MSAANPQNKDKDFTVQAIEQLFLDKIKVIGDEEFTLLGYPAELIDKLTALHQELLGASEKPTPQEEVGGNQVGKLIKVAIPPPLTFADPAYNPAFDVDTQQYKWITIAQYKQEQEVKKHKYTIEWYEKHKQADAIVVNQDGVPLYALYQAPEAHHEEAVAQLFKHLRAIKLNEWEEEL